MFHPAFISDLVHLFNKEIDNKPYHLLVIDAENNFASIVDKIDATIPTDHSHRMTDHH